MAAYVSTEILKKHLNIDSDFTDDDEYIALLETAAEEAVSKYIDYPLANLENSEHAIPQAVCHAIMLLVGTWYNTRESVGNGLAIVPNAFELLCDLFRDYTIDKQ